MPFEIEMYASVLFICSNLFLFIYTIVQKQLMSVRFCNVFVNQV